ncbi:MAG: hypothetical protein ISQ08_07015 [Planctomycetes bacterium]|nr:hypothetical protein [Planctomycetota bacterium]
MRDSRAAGLLMAAALLLGGGCGEGGSAEPAGGGRVPTTAAAHGRGVLGRGLVITSAADPSRPYFHRVGPMSTGVRAAHTFTLRNDDPEPVAILALQPACACVRPVSLETVGEPPRRGRLSGPGDLLVIQPGEEAALTLRIDSDLVGEEEHNRDKLVVVRLRTSSVETPFLMLEVSFRVERLFTLGRAELDLGRIPANGGGGSEVQILTGLPGSLARVLRVEQAPSWARLDLQEIQTGGEPHWMLVAEVDPPLDLGPRSGEVVLATTNGEGWGEDGRLVLPLRAQVVEDVVLDPRSATFSEVRQGQPAELELSLRSLLPGQLLRAEAAGLEGPSAPHARLDLQPAGPGSPEASSWWRATLTLLGTHPAGPVDLTVRLTTDDPGYSALERRVTGFVR